MKAAASAAGGGFRHLALLYRSPADYLPAIARFLQPGRPGDSAVLVAVPPAIAEVLNGELTSVAPEVTLIDMAELGRNPARIIPAIHDFARQHPGRQVCCISEAIWPGRTPEEVAEATRHEALTNLAFSGTGFTVVCPYDAAGLPGPVLADAACTHPAVISTGREEPSAAFLAPPHLPARCEEALPGPPAGAKSLAYSGNLRAVRAFVASAARSAGLAPWRVTDLVIAISELAANTLSHTGAGGTMHIWPAGGELICQVQDSGRIADELARHRAPAADMPGGKGLWLVNQVCDLVQARTGPAGTTTRLHMRLS